MRSKNISRPVADIEARKAKGIGAAANDLLHAGAGRIETSASDQVHRLIGVEAVRVGEAAHGSPYDGFELFLTVTLYPSFVWDDQAYHIDKDPEQRTYSEILVDLLAADIIEPWGGGKWHLEVFRSTSSDPEEWNGEL